MITNSECPIIQVHDLCTELGGVPIHEDLNLTVDCGEILAIVGGSGSGKSALLKHIWMLHHPVSGSIRVFGHDIWKASSAIRQSIRERWGVMFQRNALFSSMTVLENVKFPLEQVDGMTDALKTEIAYLKLAMVGLPLSAAHKYPSELSGGMAKRVALARSIVLDPELLFLDEPTTGLDPLSASGLDELILDLHKSLGLTIVMVTHDLDTLWTATSQVAFIGEKKVLAKMPISQLVGFQHPEIQAYFSSQRSRRFVEG